MHAAHNVGGGEGGALWVGTDGCPVPPCLPACHWPGCIMYEAATRKVPFEHLVRGGGGGARGGGGGGGGAARGGGREPGGGRGGDEGGGGGGPGGGGGGGGGALPMGGLFAIILAVAIQVRGVGWGVYVCVCVCGGGGGVNSEPIPWGGCRVGRAGGRASAWELRSGRQASGTACIQRHTQLSHCTIDTTLHTTQTHSARLSPSIPPMPLSPCRALSPPGPAPPTARQPAPRPVRPHPGLLGGGPAHPPHRRTGTDTAADTAADTAIVPPFLVLLFIGHYL